MGIGHVDVSVLVESQAVRTGATELTRPSTVAAKQQLEVAAGIEFLDALVPGVRNEEVILFVHSDPAKHEKLSWGCSMARPTLRIDCTQRPQGGSIRADLLHPVIGLVGDENIAPVVGRQTLGIVKLTWKLASLLETECC